MNIQRLIEIDFRTGFSRPEITGAIYYGQNQEELSDPLIKGYIKKILDSLNISAINNEKQIIKFKNNNYIITNLNKEIVETGKYEIPSLLDCTLIFKGSKFTVFLYDGAKFKLISSIKIGVPLITLKKPSDIITPSLPDIDYESIGKYVAEEEIQEIKSDPSFSYKIGKIIDLSKSKGGKLNEQSFFDMFKYILINVYGEPETELIGIDINDVEINNIVGPLLDEDSESTKTISYWKNTYNISDNEAAFMVGYYKERLKSYELEND